LKRESNECLKSLRGKRSRPAPRPRLPFGGGHGQGPCGSGSARAPRIRADQPLAARRLNLGRGRAGVGSSTAAGRPDHAGSPGRRLARRHRRHTACGTDGRRTGRGKKANLTRAFPFTGEGEAPGSPDRARPDRGRPSSFIHNRGTTSARHVRSRWPGIASARAGTQAERSRPTRLVTRTKESNAHASDGVANPTRRAAKAKGGGQTPPEAGRARPVRRSNGARPSPAPPADPDFGGPRCPPSRRIRARACPLGPERSRTMGDQGEARGNPGGGSKRY